jgi:hypothetical protein
MFMKLPTFQMVPETFPSAIHSALLFIAPFQILSDFAVLLHFVSFTAFYVLSITYFTGWLSSFLLQFVHTVPKLQRNKWAVKR